MSVQQPSTYSACRGNTERVRHPTRRRRKHGSCAATHLPTYTSFLSLCCLALMLRTASAARPWSRASRGDDLPPPVGARYGHNPRDRAKDDLDRRRRGVDRYPDEMEGRNGRSMGGTGGNVFWRQQWHLPFRPNLHGRVEDGVEPGSEYDDGMMGGAQNGYGFGGRVNGQGLEAEDHEDTDRRPWSNLIPRFRVKVEPMTTLKLRKRFYPFGTVIELGADYNTQIGVWQFRSSWEDRFIGGRFSVKGRELLFTKSWLVTLGDNDDIATRLKFRAGIDTATWRSYARLGMRTERLQPVSLKDGVMIRRRLSLDGPDGHAKLEVRANLYLPEPEIEYSTDKKRLIMGTGDIQLSLDELNLCLEY